MKTFPRDRISRAGRKLRQQAYTLGDMMVSMGVFVTAMAALLSAHTIGLKQDQLVQSKLGASDESRKSFGKMAKEIRSATAHSIGNISGSSFTSIPPGYPQRGSAIQLIFTLYAVTNSTVTYYFDTSAPDNIKLCRRSSRPGETEPTVVAQHLINSLTFSAEDYLGNIITDISDRRLIHFTLDFRQYQFPTTKVGSNYLYDRYTMDFRLTPHVPGGR
jgi:hypothetical protein